MFFPLMAELKGHTLVYHRSHACASEPAENLIDPREQAIALIDWLPLPVAIIFTALLPDGAGQHWHTKQPHAPHHCVNRWTVRRWVISHGARMQNIKEGGSLTV